MNRRNPEARGNGGNGGDDRIRRNDGNDRRNPRGLTEQMLSILQNIRYILRMACAYLPLTIFIIENWPSIADYARATAGIVQDTVYRNIPPLLVADTENVLQRVVNVRRISLALVRICIMAPVNWAVAYLYIYIVGCARYMMAWFGFLTSNNSNNNRDLRQSLSSGIIPQPTGFAEHVVASCLTLLGRVIKIYLVYRVLLPVWRHIILPMYGIFIVPLLPITNPPRLRLRRNGLQCFLGLLFAMGLLAPHLAQDYYQRKLKPGFGEAFVIFVEVCRQHHNTSSTAVPSDRAQLLPLN